MRLANPDLRVICHVGDGDIYAEGLDHLIFAAKRNSDITVIVHDNRVYGLTTGQYTPTSPFGFRGRSTPGGITEHPINPLAVMLAAGATHVARGYTKKVRHLKDLFKEAIMHRGFSFIDVLQICATYFNLTDYYNAHAYEMREGEVDTGRFESALTKVREWDYDREGAYRARDVLLRRKAGLRGEVPGAHRREAGPAGARPEGAGGVALNPG